jgi:hypothetical protein
MKTGRPEYYIPSPSTVSRDVKQVFVRVRKRMAKMLQVRDVTVLYRNSPVAQTHL